MNLAMEPVRMSVKDEIVHIELNRPERLNAMNVEMVDCLIERLEEIIKSEKKVVILSGAGTGFSSGGDIQSMSAGISDPLFKEIMGKVNEMILKVFTLPQIVISAVQGPAAGLGFSLALASDYIVASQQASFGLNFIKVGLVPDGGCHYLLKKRIGYQRAKHAIWQGKTFSASESKELGIIDYFVEDDPLEAAFELAGKHLNQPFQAQIESKLILNATEVLELTKILDLESEAQGKMRKTIEHKQRIEAFLNRAK
ncbi:enoyl-CoA hydratase-related protein [Pseudalkalibacillus sp. SCS-8]|uniref:enoyl-CoA hydratase-related protein n=1 Tax=Pseudalkalibacillus nanhaiensis TaxID=3115291 RepID=UPI0032DB491A